MSLIQTRSIRNWFFYHDFVNHDDLGGNVIETGGARCLQRLWVCLALPAALLAGCASSPSGLPAMPSAPSLVAGDKGGPVVIKPLRIGLELGGGAARGFAHVGVIAVLEEAGLRPQLVVGTSAGSLVAALYASGRTSAQMQQTAFNMEEVAITDWMLPIIGRGLFRGDSLARYVNDLVAGPLIQNMDIPLGIVATDLNSGQAVLCRRYLCRLRSGAASMSMAAWCRQCQCILPGRWALNW